MDHQVPDAGEPSEAEVSHALAEQRLREMLAASEAAVVEEKKQRAKQASVLEGVYMLLFHSLLMATLFSMLGFLGGSAGRAPRNTDLALLDAGDLELMARGAVEKLGEHWGIALLLWLPAVAIAFCIKDARRRVRYFYMATSGVVLAFALLAARALFLSAAGPIGGTLP